MKTRIIALFAVILFAGLQSCTDKVETALFHYSDSEYETLTRSLDLPEGTFDYTVVTNRPIPGFNPDLPFHKATLGRVLFYDKALSIDGSTSCASCHRQENAFADKEKFSEGLEGKIGTRNSLPLGNTIGFVKYYGTDLSIQSGFFSWDSAFETINDQSEAAITSPNEMGHNMWELASYIKDQDHYQVLFDKAYGGSAPITEANILDAVTEFVNSMSSRESHFDKSIPAAGQFGQIDMDQNFTGFSNSENLGKTLFNNNCGSCHGTTHNAIVQATANNGLDMVYADKGVGGKQNVESLYGVFKVPSLRNIELTGPYMHDGRFSTLEEVVDHYSSGIQNHPNLSFALRNAATNQASGFDFSSSEKAALVDYMKTLTDDVFIADVKYSDPWK